MSASKFRPLINYSPSVLTISTVDKVITGLLLALSASELLSWFCIVVDNDINNNLSMKIWCYFSDPSTFAYEEDTNCGTIWKGKIWSCLVLGTLFTSCPQNIWGFLFLLGKELSICQLFVNVFFTIYLMRFRC